MGGNLGEFVTGLKWEGLPPQVKNQAKLCLLDFLAAGLAGSKGEGARRGCSLGWSILAGGSRQVSLLGSREKMGLLGATFANAVAASDLDIDDGHRGAVGHPGAALFPPALALAEVLDPSGAEFLTAVVIGYQVAIEAGERLYQESRDRFFGSGTWAAMGVAAACSRLLGLSAVQAEDAVGIAEAHAPLSPVLKSIEEGAMVKESIGWAAVTGLSSVFLARAGFTGITSLAAAGDYSRKQFHIQKVYFKQYPSCRWSHPVLDAVLSLPEGERSLEKICKVEVHTFRKALTLANYRPTSSYQAQYSIPFPVGAALARGRFTPAELDGENLLAPDILAAARRVYLHLDLQREGVFPEKCTARLVVEKIGGSRIDLGIWQARGDWDNPFSPGELEAKFLRLTEGVIAPEEQRRVLVLVKSMEENRPNRLLASGSNM